MRFGGAATASDGRPNQTEKTAEEGASAHHTPSSSEWPIAERRRRGGRRGTKDAAGDKRRGQKSVAEPSAATAGGQKCGK